MTKLGLIGAGNWGQNFIRTINNLEDVDIYALVTSNVSNAYLIKDKKPGLTVCDDWESLIKRARELGIDGFIIATPPNTHKEIIEKCLAYEVPFLCEKPLCDNLEDTEYLCYRINLCKVPCMVDYTQTYTEGFKCLKKLLINKNIHSADLRTRCYGPHRENISMLWDYLPHELSILYSLNIAPHFTDIDFYPHKEIKNAGCIYITSSNQMLGISLSNVSSEKRREVVVGTDFEEYTLLGNDNLWERWAEEDYSSERRINVPEISPLTNVVNNFINVIKNETLLDTRMTSWIARTIDSIEKKLLTK